jgi:hypothetical protein
VATEVTENTTEVTTTSRTTIAEEGVPTISNITDQTQEDEEDMDEDDDGLKQIMPNGIPSKIEKFIPNVQWMKDIPKNLPKRGYGVEIKISPAKHPTPTTTAPSYHHIQIFKAMVTAILTAAPGTGICSIDDDEDMITQIEDIPTTQSMVDYYLEAPIVNTKTHTYHARIYIYCIKPLFIIMKNDSFMQW